MISLNINCNVLNIGIIKVLTLVIRHVFLIVHIFGNLVGLTPTIRKHLPIMLGKIFWIHSKINIDDVHK